MSVRPQDMVLNNTMDQAQFFMKEMYNEYRRRPRTWEALGLDLRRCSVENFFNICQSMNCQLQFIGFNLAGSKFS